MRKLPVPPNETERLRALINYQILDTLTEQEYDRLTRLASLLCQVPISLITFVDENRQWFKSRHGLELCETARELAFCQHAIMDTQLFEVEDALKDERFRLNDLVVNEPHIRFYAGYPLIDPKGYALGTLCVLDRQPGKLTAGQQEGLRLLAQEVMTLLVERKQKEDLRNFEKLFRLSNDLICIAGADGFFSEVNPAFSKILGWDNAYLLSNSFFELIHPDDLQGTIAEIEKLKRGEISVNFVNRFRTVTGSYRTLQWVAAPEENSQNLYAIGRDITEKRRREQQLRTSENRFRSFFDNSQGFLCIHDLKGNLLSVNSVGAKLVGFTTEELTKMSLFDIVPERHHGAVFSYLEEIRKNGVASGLLHTISKDGPYKMWMFNNVLERNADGTEYVIGNSVDITESHQLATDLQRTKEMLEQTSRIARVGGWEYDLVKNKIKWSEITREIHGVGADFEPDRNTTLRFLANSVLGEESFTDEVHISVVENSWDVEMKIVTAQGKELWIRSRGNAEFSNGKCVRLYGTVQDIDEKKQVELEIYRSRKLLEDVLKSASEVSIIATDPTGVITLFNAGAEKLLGYRAEEMVGKYSPQIIHLDEEIERKSRELTEEFGERIEGFRVFVYKSERKGVDKGEWTYVRKDGSHFSVSLIMTTIRDYNNEVIGYLGIGTDLSERKKIEEALMNERLRLLAFVENAPAAVAMFDREIRYIAYSNRWVEEYHLSGRNLIGVSHYDIFPDISQAWKEAHQRSLQGGIEINEEDVWRPAGWDHDQYLRWEVRPWYQFDGTVGGIMMFTQDITEICLQRKELKMAKILAEEASIAKSEFLANMSHEIRTPLNGVIGFTDLVLKTRLDETQKQYLSIVNQSANALLSIINDILDFSKIEAGKLELSIEKSDLYEIGSQSADIISYQVQNKGLEMLLNIAPDLPRFIWIDEVRLKQVLINLLGNAAKFTEKGEIELKITALEKFPELGEITVRFEVRDTGIGIKPEKMEKIFEAFLQEDSSTTKKYGGTGLGLTISNKLLALMNSCLHLTSNPGKGSTFYFDLRLKVEEGEKADRGNVDFIKNVLIVDDNDNNRLIIKQMLLLRDIHSQDARNGMEAIRILSESTVPFDVILMDYQMPYMDGLETIRKIRWKFDEENKPQPFIMLLSSSSDDEKVARDCIQLNVHQRLVKPIKIADLYQALVRLNEEGMNLDDDKRMSGVYPSANSFRVLIAEDNMVNMIFAKTIVSRIAPNAVILEASTGYEAIRHYEETRPDIILMDIQMPEMNGYQAARLIRNGSTSGPRVPIIALTAGNVKGEKEKCLEVGMDDFIAKPFVEETIVSVFKRWLPLFGKQE